MKVVGYADQYGHRIGLLLEGSTLGLRRLVMSMKLAWCEL
jgi:hypothetical protein